VTVDPSCGAEHCVPCSDEGLPLRVLDVGAEGATCLGADGAVHREVAVDLVAPVARGEVLLVHAGVALQNLGLQR